MKRKINTKVSIIIPAYNAERKLPKCLDALLKQSHKNMEIIVVNNGSMDNTKKIVERYIKKNKSIKILNQQKQGPGPAKNAAAKIAKGDILVFVDSDEYPHKDYLEKLTKPIAEGKAGISIGSWIIADPKNVWARCRYPDVYSFKQHAVHSGVFRAIGKKAFLRTGGFDPTKGISDDRLNTGLERARVDDAIFDHDVDNTLSEIYKKRKWIGKSVIGNPKGKKFKIKVFLGILFLILAIIGSIVSKIILFILLNLLILAGLFSTLKKVFFYKDARLLMYYPFYLIIYGVAMTQGLLDDLFLRIMGRRPT